MSRIHRGQAKSSPSLQLDRLACDNAFLNLDRSLRRFNVFEAVGAIRQELRHSDFLAFLLNPYSNHGLKGSFAEILLDGIKGSARNKAYSATLPVKPDSFHNAEVRREWRNIDILVLFSSSKLALIIENKIDSPERDGQLKKYWETVVEHFPGWEVRGVYLTPEGDEPGNRNYIPVGYDLISNSLQKLQKRYDRSVTGDFKVAVRHYNAMITQKITRQLEDKCWSIYTKHQYALDMIRDYVDRSDPTRQRLKDLIKRSPTLEYYKDRQGYIQFGLREWAKIPFQKSKRVLNELIFFEFQYGAARRANGSLVLLLVISNDSNGGEPVKAFNHAKRNCPPFRAQGSLSKYPIIFDKELLSKGEMDTLDRSTEQKLLGRRWSDFLTEELPLLNKAIQMLAQ